MQDPLSLFNSNLELSMQTELVVPIPYLDKFSIWANKPFFNQSLQYQGEMNVLGHSGFTTDFYTSTEY